MLLMVALLLAAAAPTMFARTADLPHGVTAASAPPPLEYLSGTVILKLRKNALHQRDHVAFGVPGIDQVLETVGLTARRPLFPMAPFHPNVENGVQGDVPATTRYTGFDRVYVVHFDGPYDAAWVGQQLEATGQVEFAEPYYIFHDAYTPNDPHVSQQYWLNSVRLPDAWDITRGDTSVVVAIVDSGTQWTHEDLTSQIWTNPGESGKDSQGHDRSTNGIDDDGNGYVDDYHGWDLVGNANLQQLQTGTWTADNDPAPVYHNIAGYEGDHGTSTAGCAAAATDNGVGIAGAGFGCRLLPVKVAADSLATGSIVAGYDGLRYAADMGARVINASWGGAAGNANVQALQQVIDYAFTKGALVVAASGNEGVSNDLFTFVPASLDHVLSVGATDSRDSVASFSNFGIDVDVWAPGSATYTTTIAERGTYASPSGTSFSCPIVAGIAGLVCSVHPDWTPDQVAMQIRTTGDHLNLSQYQYQPRYWKRANAFNAVGINRVLANPKTSDLPGIGLVDYTVSGGTSGLIRSTDDELTVTLTLKNYLAPTRALKIEALPNQTLMTVAPVDVPSIGTLQTATQDIHVKLNPNSVLISEGQPLLVLKLSDGLYDDVVPIRVPVRLPDPVWHSQFNPYASSTQIFQGTSISIPSNKTGWCSMLVQQSVGSAAAQTRTTSGSYWQSPQLISTGSEPIYCVTARDGQNAWAGSGPTSGQAGVLHTTNGGSSWARADVSSITDFVDGVRFFSPDSGVMIGDPINGRWGIATTTNGGATWQPLASTVPAAANEAGWNNAVATHGDRVWFGTNNSKIFRSTDRGRTWTSSQTPFQNALTLAFGTANDGIATFSDASGVGAAGLAATHDGGVTWTVISLPFAGADPHGITFVPDSTHAFLATQIGLWETTNFGQTWKQMAVPELQTYAGMWLDAAIDTSTGDLAVFGLSALGEIMSYKLAGDGPVSSVGTAVSPATSGAVLFEATPSPSSRSARMGYSLDAAAEVRLDLYDASGRRVGVLDEGRREAGEHRVTVDVSALPAGTYFYTLRVGAQLLTRRLLVVR